MNCLRQHRLMYVVLGAVVCVEVYLDFNVELFKDTIQQIQESTAQFFMSKSSMPGWLIGYVVDCMLDCFNDRFVRLNGWF